MDDEGMKARMAVAEEKLQRLQSDTEELSDRVASIEKCVLGIPRIEDALKGVLEQLKFLNECKIAAEATNKANVSWLESPLGKLTWDLARAAIIGGIGWFALVNNHIILAGGR